MGNSLSPVLDQPIGGYTAGGDAPLAIQPPSTNSTNASGWLGTLSSLGSDALKAFSINSLSGSGSILPGAGVLGTTTTSVPGATITTTNQGSITSSSAFSWLLILGLVALAVGLFLKFK